MSNAKGTKLSIYHPSRGWVNVKDLNMKSGGGIASFLSQGWKTKEQKDRIEKTRFAKRLKAA